MAGNAVSRGVPRQILQGANPSVPVVGAGQLPTIQYSTGSARALQQFSRDMFSLSGQFEDQLDAQAEAEANTKGALAGIAGNFELQDYGTIRGRAFNKAALETMAATVETKSIVQLQELQAKYGADPEQLDTAIRNWTKGAVDEISKFDPAAGVALEQRMLIRGAPAVEAARDTAFKLTKDQADAALIEAEVAMNNEVKTVATDLFSENPARSGAAARSIGMVQAEYMKIYNATDPVTGRPLFSAEARAKAKKDFTSKVMRDATMAWFENQPDKAGAYQKFITGDFGVNVNTTGGTARVIDANKGKTRNDPIQPKLRNQLSTAASAIGDGIDVRVISGGQETAAEVRAGLGSRTGGPRHDHGGAGDVQLVVNGKPVTPNENRELYLKFAENAAAAGITGIGIDFGGGYIHLGGGPTAAWGYGPGGGRAKYLPDDFKAAIERGRAAEPLQTEPTTTKLKVRDTLPPDVLNAIDADMRQAITFSNQQIDRRDKAAKEELEARQNANEFELSARIFADGQTDPETGRPIPPLTTADILEASRKGLIDDTKGQALIKALNVEKPPKSDASTYNDLRARVYQGEDILMDVLRAGDKLSKADSNELLGKNQSLNRAGGDDLTKDQKFYLDNLDKLLTPTGFDAKYDEGRQERRFLALDEFRRRVRDPEEVLSPREIALEIKDRATADGVSMDRTELGRRVQPRFSVPATTGGNRIDPAKSAIALSKARKENRITETEYKAEQKALLDWVKIQRNIEAAEEQRKEKAK